jgi:hypothetical protein
MKRHELKTDISIFKLIMLGKKTAELRKDDRGFKPGHFLILKEWNSELKRFTGRQRCFKITHILRAEDGYPGLKKGFVMISMRPASITQLNIWNE